MSLRRGANEIIHVTAELGPVVVDVVFERRHRGSSDRTEGEVVFHRPGTLRAYLYMLVQSVEAMTIGKLRLSSSCTMIISKVI